MEIKDRIKELRQSLKLSQAKFAEPIGITNGYVSDLEKGKGTPSEPVLRLIEIIYRTNRNWLISGDGPIFKNDIRPSEDQNIQSKLEKAKAVLNSGTRHAVTLGSNIEDSFRLLEMDQKRKDEAGGDPPATGTDSNHGR